MGLVCPQVLNDATGSVVFVVTFAIFLLLDWTEPVLTVSDF